MRSENHFSLSLSLSLNNRDDPRMPTPRGLQRRGLAIEALKEFIIAQHSSGSCETAKWNTLWSINQRVIGRRAHRYASV